MPQTAQQAAASLFALLAKAMPAPLLEDYGIETSSEQVQRISREVLALHLYWAHHALTTVLAAQEGERVYGELMACLTAQWPSTPGLEGQSPAGFREEAEERRQAYDRIVQEGGSPVAVFTETVEFLESAWAIRPEDRQKMLALLIDVVPVDDIGDFVAELDLLHK